MFTVLKEIKEAGRVGDFLFPSLPCKVKGKVGFLSAEMVVIESAVDGDLFQYITHPNNVCIVQKKS